MFRSPFLFSSARTIFRTILLILFTSLFSFETQAQTVNSWITTPDKTKLLSPQSRIRFGNDGNSAPLVIDVNDAQSFQRIEGFGGSFTDSSAWLVYNKLTVAQRLSLMTKLFHPSDGIGLNYLRQPMGASDFALGFYSYNDLPRGETDPNLSGFSIERDKSHIIPVIKQAQQLNPNLKIMATPWSPPAWMITSESLIGGSLKPEYYGSFANYFVKFIRAYEAEGIPIHTVTLQNEPQYSPPDYPGMYLTSSEQAQIVKDHLGPAFEQSRINAKIIAGDVNWDESYYPIGVLNDSAARSYVAGAAFHGYSGSPEMMSNVNEAHPVKGIYFTEITAGDWNKDFGSNLKWDLQNLIIGSLRNWAKTVIKFNLALDENFGPHIGGCTNCNGIVTVNQSTGAVTYNYDYYSLGHVSKFVDPGAYRIQSNTFGNNSIETVAFKNPDGTKVLIALNSSASSKKFKVRFSNQSFTYTLSPGAVATFKWF